MTVKTGNQSSFFGFKTISAIRHDLIIREDVENIILYLLQNLETCMLDIMYELPSLENIHECIITEDVVLGKGNPIFTYQPSKIHA